MASACEDIAVSVPLAAPDVNEAEVLAVVRVLTSDRLSLGPELPRFEQAIADRVGRAFAVAVNSGTSGLHLCVKAAGVTEGDEVITTPFSFVASANCILFEQARPVFVDIDPVTYNLDPTRVEGAITRRTKAILPVHVFGCPCRMSDLVEMANRRRLTLIEDACEALGATYNGRPVGSFGQTGVFAFYPNKQITTGEGGVIVTDDREIARLCRSWRNQGRGDNGAWLQHERLGYNYRLSDIQCALGAAQLKRLDQILARRAQIAVLYGELLKDVPEVIPPPSAEPGAEISWFVYVVRLADDFRPEHRDAVLDFLKRRNIGCSNYFAPIHFQPFYQKQFGFKRGDFPITERISERTIALPFFNRITEAEIQRVCMTLREAVSSLRF